jgi:glucose-6-phosphate isomerase
MLPSIQPNHTNAWNQLSNHAAAMKSTHMRQLFQQDPDRFEKFSLCAPDLAFDYSKNILTTETISLLLQLANECGLKDAIEAMFNGEKINATEGRSVLHVALRANENEQYLVDGNSVVADVHKVLAQMEIFCAKIHSGEWKGYTGKPIKYIVNIGIGGSDLGPVMVTEALRPYWKEGIQTYFVSNIDGTHMAETLKKVTPGFCSMAAMKPTWRCILPPSAPMKKK